MSYRRHIVDFEERSVALFTACTLGFAGAAFAESTAAAAGSEQEVAAMCKQADKNSDKALNMPAVSEQFKTIDANGDGAISEAEFMATMKTK
ncbi:EF-hand domain-containing protein [Hydrogenophaga sp.]|uniref:EF-hand domain-containing protein n=1 Tax=Hydrogenophaga sp. TaxID=1904254 RepID=UPI0025B96458|nr:EF-hand domain-containing protein [Hydrogenophaga sp.]